MKITESQLRKIVKKECGHVLSDHREGFRLDEQGTGVFGVLKGLVTSMFGALGNMLTGTTTEYRAVRMGDAEASVGKSQEALGRKEPKAWADLKPHDDNVDKAAWAIAVGEGMGKFYGDVTGRLMNANALESIAPPNPDEAEEWEKGEDANRLKDVYKGIGEAKGTLEWLGTHLTSAKTLADSIDENASLEDLLQQMAGVGEYLAGDLKDGLESAKEAVGKAGDEYKGQLDNLINTIQSDGDHLTKMTLSGVTRVKELKEKAEELAGATEAGGELEAAAQGMPEALLRKYIRVLLS
jgi:hypothetical protein